MNAWTRRLILLGILGAALAGCQASSSAATPQPASSPTPTVVEPASTLPVPTATMAPTPDCAETQGQIVQATMTSALVETMVRYRVYLPPCYDFTGKQYPTLIMMHGWVENSDAMNDDQWVRLGLAAAEDQGIAAGKLPPMIIVMPNGNDMDQGSDGSPYAEIVATELLPEVERQFCAWPDPAMRAIGGLSRGGFWSFSVAFQYPGLFSRVGGHSLFVYSGDFKDNNPFDLLDTPMDIGSPEIWIDHGAQDYVRDNASLFAQKLAKRGVHVQYVVYPQGSHVESYWAAHVADYLAFYGADWSLDAASYPDCNR